MNKHLLLIDDDRDFLDALKQELELEGYQVDGRETISKIKDREYGYAIVDLRLKGEYGLNAISKILETSPNCRIIILSAYSSISSAVKAMKAGAINYLIKPVSMEILLAALAGDLENNSDKLDTLSLHEHEHEYIEFVLSQNDGNISKTAKLLGLHRQSLQRKLKKYK